MAALVATSSVPVSALVSGNSLTSSPPWGNARSSSSSTGRWRVQVGDPQRRSRIGSRLEAERSAFLGDDSWAYGKHHFSEFGIDKNDCSAGARRNTRFQCVGRFQGRGGGRVFFIPFGPPGRGETRETDVRRDRERGHRHEQERFRGMVEREIKARMGAASSSYEFSLLKELEKRLRAEEKSMSKDGDAEKENDSEKAAGEEEGAAGGLGLSTYELMKELEKRLRAERDTQRDGHRERHRASPERSGERTRRERRDVRDGNYSSIYDYLREWDREMREQRAQLEELWKLRDEGRVRGGRERMEERFRHRRSWHEDSRRRTAAESERKEEAENVSSVGSPKYAQTNETVLYLKNEANGAEIYLVGTSHVSQKSVDEVREVIERVKPDFVMVELCQKRYDNMERNASQKDNPMTFVEQIARMLTNANVGIVGKLVGIGLSSFYRLLSHRGFHPGREFQVAVKVGKENGAKIVLGDQDIDSTMRQLGNFNLNMSMQDVFKFFGQSMPQDIAESMGGKGTSDEDMFEMMRNRKVVRRFNEELERGAPTIYKALVTERNEVMVKALRDLNGKVVAVVGLAHMDGMEQLWHEANEKYMSGQSDKTEKEGGHDL